MGGSRKASTDRGLVAKAQHRTLRQKDLKKGLAILKEEAFVRRFFRV